MRGACAADDGVPVVLEQKTTILWKCLYLLTSLKDSSGLGGTWETKCSSEEENPVHRQNTTVNVDKIRGFRPPYVLMKTFVFPHSLTVYQRCVVFCTLASAPSKARLCQSGVGPDPGSPGQTPGTACCVVEGNDNGEAYTGR